MMGDQSLRPNKNTHFLVKNLEGTSKRKCKCGSWIEHWRKFTGLNWSRCAVMNCGKKAEVGAHVIGMDERMKKQWWIAPFCKTHNFYKMKEMVYLDSRTVMASANVSISCHYHQDRKRFRVRIYKRVAERCHCGTWMEHWRNISGSMRSSCAVMECNRAATEGTHVMIMNGRQNEDLWVAPFCSHHFNKSHEPTEGLYLDSRITLVSNNRSLTCNHPDDFSKT